MIRQAAILCGGLGTRLGPLTARTPKPLLPVAGRPFLDVLLWSLGGCGVRQALLLAGFAAEEITRYATSTPVRERFGIDIRVSVEPEPAGTGGAVWHSRDLLDETFFLLNGDSWFDIDLPDLADALVAVPSATAVLAVREAADAARYGAVEIGGSGLPQEGRSRPIAGFADRPAGAGPGLVSGGIYACRRKLVDHLRPRCSLEQEVFPVLAADRSLWALLLDGYFIDIGVPAAFDLAQRDIASAWIWLEEGRRATPEARETPKTNPRG